MQRWRQWIGVICLLVLGIFLTISISCEKFEDCDRTYSVTDLNTKFPLKEGRVYCFVGNLSDYNNPDNLNEVYMIEDDAELIFQDVDNPAETVTIYVMPEHYNTGIFNHPNPAEDRFHLPAVGGITPKYRIQVIAALNEAENVVPYMIHLRDYGP